MSNPFLPVPGTNFLQGDLPDPSDPGVAPFDPSTLLDGNNSWSGQNNFNGETNYAGNAVYQASAIFEGGLISGTAYINNAGGASFDNGNFYIKEYSEFDSDQYTKIFDTYFRQWGVSFNQGVNFASGINVYGSIYLNGEPISSGGGGGSDPIFNTIQASSGSIGSASFDSTGISTWNNISAPYASFAGNNFDSSGAYLGNGLSVQGNVSFFGATGQGYPGTVYYINSGASVETVAATVNNLQAVLQQFGLVSIS